MELSSGFKKIACVCIGVVFLVMGYQDYSKNKSLHKRGAAAIVEPISKYTEHSRKGSTTYTAEFDFTTTSGQKIHKSSSFPKEALDDFKAGKPVKVFYDERNPYEFVFEKDSPAWWPMLLGGPLSSAGCCFCDVPAAAGARRTHPSHRTHCTPPTLNAGALHAPR
jgi:hypothetical protein